jgi:hypothetical protein
MRFVLTNGEYSEASFLLVHFKSRDLEHLHKQGRFWHLFTFANGSFGGAVISQDERVCNNIQQSRPVSLKQVYVGHLHYPLSPLEWRG